jgi:thioredoxin-like negative regulator of GroEL
MHDDREQIVVFSSISPHTSKQALAAIDFAGDVELIGTKTLAELMKKVADDNKEIQAWYDIAVLLFVGGKAKEAIKAGCTCLLKDKKWNDEAAKKLINRMLAAMVKPNHSDDPASPRFSRPHAFLFSGPGAP